MDRLETFPWRSEDHLASAEDIAAYLEAAFEDGDPELIAHAFDVVSRAKPLTSSQR